METADKIKASVKVGLFERLSMGGFALSNDLGNNFRSNYRMYFYTNVLALSPFLAGLVTMIGTLWDGINDPLIGYAADRHRFKNGEKIRPFAKWFAIPTAILFIFLFLSYEAPMWAKAAISILLLLLFHTASTALQIALFGMPMVMTDDQRQRVSINTFVTAGATIGIAIASVVLWPLIQACGGLDSLGNIIDEPRGFLIGASVVAVIYAITPLIAYRACKERIISPKPQAGEKIWSTLKLLFKYKNWRLNLSFELIYYVSNLLMTSNMIYYAKYVQGSSSYVTLVMALYMVGSLIMFPFVGVLNRKFGRKKTMSIAALVLIASKVVLLINMTSLTLLMAHSVLVGVGVAICSVMFISNRADIVDVVAARTGRRLETIVSTLCTFVSKLAMSLVSFAIGIVLELCNYKAELAVQSIETVNCLKAMMGIAPLVLYILMIFVVSRLTIDKDVTEIKA